VSALPGVHRHEEGCMVVTILLKNGQKHEYQNADIQKKNEGRSTAVYDVNTFRIIAEYKAEQILMCQASSGKSTAARWHP